MKRHFLRLWAGTLIPLCTPMPGNPCISNNPVCTPQPGIPCINSFPSPTPVLGIGDGGVYGGIGGGGYPPGIINPTPVQLPGGEQGYIIGPDYTVNPTPVIDTVDHSAITVYVPKPPELRITSIGQLISSLISLVLVIAGILAFVYLIWGGLQWITSGGDKGNVEVAQKRIQAALVGLFIVFASWAVMLLIQSFLGVNFVGGSFPIQLPY